MKHRYAFVLFVLIFASTLSVAQVTVKFQKPASWTAVSLYTWGPELLNGWPGASLTEVDGWYSYTFNASYTGANLIFNSAGVGVSEQALDYVATTNVCLKATTKNGDGKYMLDVVPCTAPGIKVTFIKPASWLNVNLYAYVNNAPIIGNWPGAILTEVNGVYSYTFDATYTGVSIIYNNGTAQLPDTYVTASTCFKSTDGVAITAIDCATITGISSVKEKSLKIYPNPIVDKINFSSFSTIERVTISSVTGKNVLTDTQLSKNGMMDVKSLKPGVYFVSIYYSDGKKQVEKIVKR